MEDLTQKAEEFSPVKRAILELREMRAKLETLERMRSEPIAIIGMACRFPGQIDNPESYWRFLQGGHQAICEIPQERWDTAAYFDPDPEVPGKMYVRHGGFLSGVDLFDPYFFGITPREAINMDPQQRLLLEVSWEALENAGLAASQLMGGSTGVFVGIGGSDYALLQMKSLLPEDVDVYLATGTSHSVAAGRLSYFFGFEGPCVSVDTACSSSLVAIHQACQSLRLGECGMALAAGASLMLLPEININFCKARMLAPDGRCKTFDASADGYVRGEGVAVIVLKRLSDAIEGKDRILALIRGSAINQDGRTSGLTVPNGPAQESVIRQALKAAGVDPLAVQYVEAHGTGTSLGDPIEINGLAAALCQGRSLQNPLIVGSVKTNLGHLESSAGIAGLIKVVLSLQNKEIPAHLHLKHLNSHVNWDQIPILIPTERRPWLAETGRRIAGVSSFGFSGTNAHIVLEESPDEAPGTAQGKLDRPLQIMVLSGKSEKALSDLAERYIQHLTSRPEERIEDLCYTAAAGRNHFQYRLAVTGDSSARISKHLSSFLAGEEEGLAIRGDAVSMPQVVFLFTGQGGQYVNMGRGLYEREPTFRRVLERCDELLRPHMAKGLLSVLYPEAGAATPLDQTEYTHVAMFAIQYGLAELWRSWGVEPGAVMGHSVGEIVGAVVAGGMSFEDGLMLVRERGRLMQQVSANGMMASLLAGEEQAAAAIEAYRDRVSIAAVNGPESTVISGERDAVQAIVKRLEEDGVKVKILKVSNSFHSPLVDPVLEEFERVANGVRYEVPQVGLYSSMRLEWVGEGRLLDGSYWRHNLRHTVRFSEGMSALWAEGYRVFLEIGPAPILVSMGSQCVPEGAGVWLPSLREGRDDWEQILESLGRLYVSGVKVDWAGFDKGYDRRKVSLPTYPFQRQRYWIADKERPGPFSTANPKEEWTRIVEAGRLQSRTAPLDLTIDTFPGKWQALERFTLGYMISTLRAFDFFTHPGEKHSVDELLGRSGISSIYRKLLSRWLERLRQEGWLLLEDGVYTNTKALKEIDLESLRSETRELFRDYPALLQYTERCGDRLVEVLTGKESPLETLFPNGSYELVEGLYQNSAVARYFNNIVRQTIDAVSRERGKIHILEIGAGTGGTTSAILPALIPERVAYTFTDVSPLFLNRAEEKFEAYRFLRYSLLDIEKDLVQQGYPLHGYDVVIAANVIHATCDLKTTLEKVGLLLASGGILILLETTRHPCWFDITTGLIEGWQKFGDDRRKDNPLLSAEQWCELLSSCGYEGTVSLPEPGSTAEVLGLHVLVSRGAVIENAAHSAVAFSSRAGETTQKPRENVRPDILANLEAALPGERIGLLANFVRNEVIKVLGMDGTQVPELNQRLMELGVDSLMAIELRNRISSGLGLRKKLTATLIFDYPSIQSISEYLAREILVLEAPEETSHQSQNARVDLVAAEIEKMDDADVEDRLLEKLREI